MKSETLCLTNRKFLFPARWPMFTGLPVIRLSMAMTLLLFREKPIRQMRAEKTRASGDHRNGF